MKESTPAGRGKKRKFWEEHVREWRASGATQAEYCRIHRIRKNSFGYWKRKLIPTKVPVSLVELVRLEPVPASPVFKPIQLRIGESYRIEIKRGFDAETLLELLRVLE